MRIAAISDVHGNVFALEAVLAALEPMRIDTVVNLGDHLSGGVAPAATADLLMRTPMISIRGNHERQLLDNRRDQMDLSDGLAYDTITEQHREWLRALPSVADVAPGVIAFHGGPVDDLLYLLETVTPDGVRPATEDEVLTRLGGEPIVQLMLCGHTHLQRQMRLRNGTLIVNPGSVGWPAYEDDVPYPHAIEAGSPHARFAVIDDATGQWEAEFHAIAYSWDQAAALAEDNGRPDLQHALLTGRVR